MRLRLLLTISVTLAAIAVFGGPHRTAAETVCLPTPPRGAPILNRWPIQTNGADCTDYPLLAVKNQTGGDYVNGGSISANPGDVLKVRLYVHNGVIDYPENIAYNAKVSANIPAGHGTQTITANAWADNAAAIDSGSKGGNVTINLAGTDYLQYVPGSAQVYGRGPVLLGSFSDSVVTGGASLGNMPGCFANLRFVTFLVKVNRQQITPGTIRVTSNVATSWVISGPDNFSGSGTQASYSAKPSPGDYFISVPAISGYTGPSISPSLSQPLPQGGSITYAIRYDPIIPPSPSYGRIVVSSNVPTSWTITGAANYSGSGTYSAYQNVPVSPPNYAISVPVISGYSAPTVSPSYSQALAANGTITYSINYAAAVAGCMDNASVTGSLPAILSPGQTVQFSVRAINNGDTWWYDGSYYQLLQTQPANLTPSYGHISPAMVPGDSQDKSFTLTAPGQEGNFSLRFQMVHRAGADYKRPAGNICAPSPASNTFFGNAVTMPFQVRIGGGGPVLNAPTLSASAADCSTINLAWQDRSNNEDGFRILRSASASSGYQTIATRPANSTSYTDNPPAGSSNYYKIEAFINSPALTAQSSSVGPVASSVCEADLSQSKKKLATITEAATGRTTAFSGSSLVRNGDSLRYEIILKNTGTAAAIITKLTDHLESNLINPRNARLAKPAGSSAAGISRSGSDVVFAAAGNLPIDTTWVLSFDVTYVSGNLKATDAISNCATVNYQAPDSRDLTVCHGPVLVNRIGAGAPEYREVAP